MKSVYLKKPCYQSKPWVFFFVLDKKTSQIFTLALIHYEEKEKTGRQLQSCIFTEPSVTFVQDQMSKVQSIAFILCNLRKSYFIWLRSSRLNRGSSTESRKNLRLRKHLVGWIFVEVFSTTRTEDFLGCQTTDV